MGRLAATPNAGNPRICPCLCGAEELAKHWDASLLSGLWGLRPLFAVAMVRDPAERFLSHFYYSFGQDWTAGLRIRAYAEDVLGYLHDDAALLETRMLWRDGNAAVAWFAGLTVDYGMGLSAEEDARRERALANRSAALAAALEGYGRFGFVGVLEDERTSGLLAGALGVPPQPFPRANFIENKPALTSQTRRAVRARLAALAPMDAWFYEFVRADLGRRARSGRCVSRVPRIPADLGGCDVVGARLRCRPHGA